MKLQGRIIKKQYKRLYAVCLYTIGECPLCVSIMSGYSYTARLRARRAAENFAEEHNFEIEWGDEIEWREDKP